MIALATTRGGHAQNPSSCAAVEQALVDRGRIKAGVTRREIERHFVQDGGAQFPGNTRYVYARCRYLHVDIEFRAKSSTGDLFSPDDIVTNASKLYVDYSNKD